jgi:hypothetical protein
VAVCQALETDGEAHVARADNVLDLELAELGLEPELLDDAGVLSARKTKMSAVVLGSRIRMMTAANRLGLYSAFRACSAIVLRSKRTSRLTVATMFLRTAGPDECQYKLLPISTDHD